MLSSKNPANYFGVAYTKCLWRHLYVARVKRMSNMVNQQDIDKQQEKLLDEKCILVNDKDENIGSASKKECHLLGLNGTPPPLHRAFSVFLFNSNKELLLQQRSDYKITFPNHFTNSCCSHPLATEDEMDENEWQGIKLAAHRRMMFELGIPGHEMWLSDFHVLTRIHYASPSMDSIWGEHEIDYIVIIKKDLTLNINENEIKKVEYVKLDEFPGYMKMLEEKNIPVTPWFKMISKNLLPLYWKNLHRIQIFHNLDILKLE